MTITPSALHRVSAIAASLAGLTYIVIQFIHPADVVASLATQAWVSVHVLSFGMAVLAMIGLAGIYLRQVRRVGILGLVGYVMFGFFFVLQAAFNFSEALVAPLIAHDAPQLAVDIVGLFGRYASVSDLGPLAALPLLGSVLYVGGALLFGIAIVRGRVLSRGAGILLIVAAVLTPAAGLLPHAIERLAAIPMGLALIWLGYSLFANLRTRSASLPLRQEGYEVRVEGQLDQSWRDWFDGFTLVHEIDGTTTLTGQVIDQAALHGLIRRVSDLGVTLISINVLHNEPATAPAAPRR